MKKLKAYIVKTKKLFKAKPKLVLPVALIVTLLVFATVECGRARIYISSSADYKASAGALQLHDTVDRITRSNELQPSAYYCNVSQQTLFLKEVATDKNRQQILTASLREQLQDVSPSPAFSSLMEVLPRPNQARNISENMNKALRNLTQLTTQDLRSEYCVELERVFSDINFLNDLSSPEGVSAMLVGQLENFQVNIAQAQEKMLAQKFPSEFEDEHVQLNEWLNSMAINLHANSNNYLVFSRTIENDVYELDVILASITEKSVDLQQRPTQIALQASYLK